MSRRPVKHSVTLNGHRTSVSREDEFWQALREIAARDSQPINVLVARIDVARGSDMGLGSAIRLYVLKDLQARLGDQATDAR